MKKILLNIILIIAIVNNNNLNSVNIVNFKKFTPTFILKILEHKQTKVLFKTCSNFDKNVFKFFFSFGLLGATIKSSSLIYGIFVDLQTLKNNLNLEKQKIKALNENSNNKYLTDLLDYNNKILNDIAYKIKELFKEESIKNNYNDKIVDEIIKGENKKIRFEEILQRYETQYILILLLVGSLCFSDKLKNNYVKFLISLTRWYFTSALIINDTEFFKFLYSSVFVLSYGYYYKTTY